MNLPTKETVLEQYNKAPKEVRDTLSSTTLSEIITDIATQNNLSIDVLKTVAENNRNMLLGLMGPQDFLQELISKGVSPEIANKIVAGLNQKVFIPTMQKVRENANKRDANTPPSQKTVSAPIKLPGQEALLNTTAPTIDTNKQKAPTSPEIQNSQQNKISQTQPATEKTEVPLVKEYAVDPYHEPIE